jgi:redox-sensitive bicupin YhaK (pirin superfamily)
MEHGDSRGNKGRIGPGDVQWMTAGSGVVHSEMPSKALLEKGGRLHGFQLWVNLPRRDKMMAPRYQEVPGGQIPAGTSADGRVSVKVLAGEALGAKAVIDTRTPIVYLDATLEPGAVFEQPVPEDFNAFAYVVEGEGVFGAERVPAGPHQIVLFRNDAGKTRIEADSNSRLRVLLIGGRPLGEPVARAGPFVMNTRAELVQAFEDFQSGRLG